MSLRLQEGGPPTWAAWGGDGAGSLESPRLPSPVGDTCSTGGSQ